MSRFSNLIDRLDALDKEDVKNTAQLLDVTAVLYERLQGLVNAQKQKNLALPEGQAITKEILIKHYGNYFNAYNAYQKSYGIKCKKGWNNLLPLVQNLPIPVSLEERVSKLENTVAFLSEVILELIQRE